MYQTIAAMTSTTANKNRSTMIVWRGMSGPPEQLGRLRLYGDGRNEGKDSSTIRAALAHGRSPCDGEWSLAPGEPELAAGSTDPTPRSSGERQSVAIAPRRSLGPAGPRDRRRDLSGLCRHGKPSQRPGEIRMGRHELQSDPEAERLHLMRAGDEGRPNVLVPSRDPTTGRPGACRGPFVHGLLVGAERF